MTQTHALSNPCPIFTHYGKPPHQVGLRDLQNMGLSGFINLLTAACSAPNVQQRAEFGYKSIKTFWEAMSEKRTIWSGETERFIELMRAQISFISPYRAQQLLEHKPKDLLQCTVIDQVTDLLEARSKQKS